MVKANAFYAQSGGVTAVINATACGVLQTAAEHKDVIGKVLVGANGIVGALNEELIDASKESKRAIAVLRSTPGGAFGSISDIDADEWDQSMAILLKSVFMGIKHASVEMKKNANGASIINTASIAGMSGGGGPQAYSAAKAAVINLSQTTALELGEFKIRVNSISPGAISTPLLNGLSDDWDERIKGLQPIDELGQPLDIAYAALFLGSDESRFITGHNLCVDGGLTVDRTGLIKGMRETAQEELGDIRISGMSMGSTGIEETLREIDD